MLEQPKKTEILKKSFFIPYHAEYFMCYTPLKFYPVQLKPVFFNLYM